MKSTIALTLTLLTVSGCATGSRVQTSPTPVLVTPDTFCAVYVPVYTAAADTEQTKRQVDKNNAVWLERCERRATPAPAQD